MRTERNRDGYHHLPSFTDATRQEVALRLMGDCGLSVAEVLDVCPHHISRPADGRNYKLEVVGGVDTSGQYDGGKHRETCLPAELERHIYVLTHVEEIDDGEPIIDRSKRTVQNWVDMAAARAADETGDDHYHRVSTHDLRRCWANHLLVEEGDSPRIVMALGGWSSYDAIEPYLAAPTEENINRAMTAVELYLSHQHSQKIESR